MEQEEIYIQSSLDGTMQPSLFFKAEGEEPRPLLVGLHTWSHDRFNQINNMLPYAEKYNFHLLLPEFRGNNLQTNPECTKACGSLLAKKDIEEAVLHIKGNYAVDAENIFLLGQSGGGHMALLMAGFCPMLFKAVAAFVPITDLYKWTEEQAAYRPHVLACCRNDREEMAFRSPVSYIDEIAKANVKIFHGKTDRVVPVTQSLSFYAQMMEKHPEARAFLDIFDGGHELDMHQAMYWILSQYQGVEKVAVTG